MIDCATSAQGPFLNGSQASTSLAVTVQNRVTGAAAGRACGFGSNIPSNGFVGAWPFIEVGQSPNGFPQPPVPSLQAGCQACFEVSCVPQFVESAEGDIYLDRR